MEQLLCKEPAHVFLSIDLASDRDCSPGRYLEKFRSDLVFQSETALKDTTSVLSLHMYSGTYLSFRYFLHTPEDVSEEESYLSLAIS